MAVDRWFGGIKAEQNIWYGGTVIITVDATKETYLIGYEAQSTDITNGVLLEILGDIVNLELNPEAVEIGIITASKVTALVESDLRYILKLKNNSRLFVAITPINAAAQTTMMILHVITLPYSGVERNTKNVIDSIKPSNNRHIIYNKPTAATTRIILENEIDSAKPIIQPYHQATPAVADELNISSTSVNDDVAGTGLQKIKFDYYDASNVEHTSLEIEMDGTTFVNIIGSYADVAYIKRIYGTQWGALGHNDGDIFIHDNI